MTNPADIDKINGYHPTVAECIPALIPFLHRDNIDIFVEPCAGAGHLIQFLEDRGFRCEGACDINPQKPIVDFEEREWDIDEADCFDWLNAAQTNIQNTNMRVFWDDVDAIITNPPYSRHHTKLYHRMIADFSRLKPTWLLLPGRFAFNVTFAPFMAYCHDVVTIGRVSWYPETKEKETSDVAWFHFDQNREFTGTKFHPYKKYEKEAA